MADRPARKKKPTTAEALRWSWGDDLSLPAVEVEFRLLRQYAEMALSEDVRSRRAGEKHLREAAVMLVNARFAAASGSKGGRPLKRRTDAKGRQIVADKTIKRDAKKAPTTTDKT